MAVTAPTNPSNGDIAGPTVVLNLDHTAEVNKAIYLVVCGRTFSGFGGHDDFDVSATFGGVAMDRWASWYSAGRTDLMRFWIFSLRKALVSPGTDTLTFTSGSASGIDEYSAIAFNVGGGALNGGVVLPGGYYPFDPVETLTKTAYGWAVGGMQITMTWGRQGASGVSIAQGTQFATASGIVANYLATNDTEISFTATRSPSGILGMCSFLIPPEESTTGGVCQPVLTDIIPIAVFSPGYAATSGFPYANLMNGSPFSGRQGNILPFPGTIRSLAFRAQLGALGSGRTVNCAFARGGYDASSGGEGFMWPSVTSVGVDLVDPDEIVLLDGQAFAFSRYEQIGMQVSYTGGSGLVSPDFAASVLLESGGGPTVNDQVYGGGVIAANGGDVDVARYVGILHPSGSIWAPTTTDERSLTGIDVVIEELVVPYQTATDLDPDFQYYVVVDDALQDGSPGTVDTTATLIPNTMNRAFARRRFSLFVPKHHFVSVAAIQRNGSSAALRHGPILRVRPAVRGEFMLSGRSAHSGPFAFLTSANSDGSKWTAGALVADELKLAQPMPPLTFVGGSADLTGVYTDLGGEAPGGSTAWAQALRVNAAPTAMPDLVIAGAETTGETGGSAPVAGGDLVGLTWTPTSLPNGTRQFWTIPGAVTPPPLEGDDEGGDDDHGGPGGSDGIPDCVTGPTLGACLLQGPPTSVSTIAVAPSTTSGATIATTPTPTSAAPVEDEDNPTGGDEDVGGGEDVEPEDPGPSAGGGGEAPLALGGWRLAQPFARGAIAIDFDTMRCWMVGHAQTDDILEFNLPAMGTGTDVSAWPRVDPVRTIPGWWPKGYAHGLLWWQGKLWASPRVFYDQPPSSEEGLTIYGIDPSNLGAGVETMTFSSLRRQTFTGFVKRGPGLDPLLGGGGYESGQGTVSGPTLATLDEIVRFSYQWLDQPGAALEDWDTRAPRAPNYTPLIGYANLADPAPGYPGDSWMGWVPRTIDGVLEGRWASDRIYGGGLVLPDGITYWPWMGTGDLDYRNQTYTFAPNNRNRTYRYRYDPVTFAFLGFEAAEEFDTNLNNDSITAVLGHELDADGNIYLAHGYQWASGPYVTDVALKVFG